MYTASFPKMQKILREYKGGKRDFTADDLNSTPSSTSTSVRSSGGRTFPTPSLSTPKPTTPSSKPPEPKPTTPSSKPPEPKQTPNNGAGVDVGDVF